MLVDRAAFQPKRIHVTKNIKSQAATTPTMMVPQILAIGLVSGPHVSENQTKEPANTETAN